MFLRTQKDDAERKRKNNLLGKQCWIFVKFSFTLELEFVICDGVCVSERLPPYSLDFIMSSQIFINAHCVFWWLNGCFILGMYIYARRGSESKYCLDSTRHNSMFISIIFLTWFRLFARTFARSLGVIILCTSAACFWEYRWIFSFSLAFNVASVEFLLQKKTKWKKRRYRNHFM